MPEVSREVSLYEKVKKPLWYKIKAQFLDGEAVTVHLMDALGGLKKRVGVPMGPGVFQGHPAFLAFPIFLCPIRQDYFPQVKILDNLRLPSLRHLFIFSF